MNTPLSTAARYSRGAVALHWIIALLIVGNFVGAFIGHDAPKEEQAIIFGYHKANGLLILGLTLLRIFWRFTHRPPPLVETLKAWEAALAKVTHSLFYALMLAIPLAGWAMSSSFSKGKPVSIFGVFDMPALPVGHDKATTGMFHEMHEILALLMLGLLVIHVVAAVKHHLVDHDGTMRRMVPWIR